MKEKVRDQIQMRLRRAAVALFSIGAVAAGTVHASPSDTVVVVPPTDLPALARQSGEAMFLHETIDGRAFHCIEQNQGARLATFDAPALDFGAIDTVLSYELTRMFDVKQVRAQMMRSDTGTTFIFGENGLYVIRRPAVEWIPRTP